MVAKGIFRRGSRRFGLWGWPRAVAPARTGQISRARREGGQATVEFALVATVFLLIAIGILYFGRLLNYTIQATHLANEAARYAAVDYNPGPGASLAATIQSQAGAELKGTGDVVGGPVSVSFCSPNTTSSVNQDPVRAIVSFKFKFLPIFNIGTVTVTQTATMLLEAAPTAAVYAAPNPCTS